MRTTIFRFLPLAILFGVWQCHPVLDAEYEANDLESKLAGKRWQAHSYMINGRAFPVIEMLHDQLRYPGSDQRTQYRHQFEFEQAGKMTIREEVETHSRFYASNFSTDWALDQDLSGCTIREEEWYVESNKLYIRGGSIDLPYFLPPPYIIQQIADDKLVLRSAIRFAGYSEDLRKSIVKLNGMITTGDGLDIDIVLVPGK